MMKGKKRSNDICAMVTKLLKHSVNTIVFLWFTHDAMKPGNDMTIQRNTLT